MRDSIKRGASAVASSPFIHPVGRLREYVRTTLSLLGETRDHVQASTLELSAHLTRLEEIASSHLAHLESITASQRAQIEMLERLAAAVDATSSFRDAQHEQVVEILRFIHDGTAGRRVKLRGLRASDAYGQAYADPHPLVSVVIPTYDNYQLLRDRAIPSVLAQTYQNFEIIVVGDAAPNEARVAVESFDDPRITFANRLYRGPYPEDPYTRWLVAGVPAYNEAVHRARGLWIAPLDDDDAFRPQHIELLLARARSEQLELCYSPMCHHRPDGSTEAPRHFPPEYGFALQSTLYHAGLVEIFELELGDAALGLPYDWALCRRMMEADVRIGMLEEETVDYFPSRLWRPRWDESLPWGRVDVPARESPEPGSPPPTKLFTAIFEDARLLPHFLRHYASVGIRDFYIAVPSGREKEIEHLVSGYRVTISGADVDDSGIPGKQTDAIGQLRDRCQGEDEWALIVDLDDFVSCRETLESIIDSAEAEGANVVRGVIYDRFSADGKTVDFEPGSDIAARYPVRARFTRDVMLGCDYRAALVKGPLAGAPRAGEHSLVDEVVATKMLDIDHYMWTTGSIDRLRERCRVLPQTDIESKAEYERAIEHYDSQGRFAWEEFGGELAQPEWEFVPEGWERAATVRSWDATEVARSYREKWPRFLDALEGAGPLGVSHEVPAGAPIERHDLLAQNSVLAYALALARARDGSRRLSVLDRGGALGHFYVLAKRLFPDLELDYHCRELSAVSAQGREVLPEVTFHDTDDCFDRTYDLVIASNSLQYEEDWRGLLRKLAHASARWTFLTRVPIVKLQASFVVLQRAYRYGYATEYLGWVLNRDELLGAATDAGLQLERELVLQNQLEIDGAPEAFTDAGFLFRAGR